MAEQIVITPQPVSTANTAFGATGALDLRLAFDISGYDLLDVQINVLTFGGATTLSIDLLHSFQNQYEDNTWDIATTASAAIIANGARAITSAVAPNNFQVPSAAGVLFRYLRWRAKVNAGTAVWTMRLMARRRSF